nr:hypothetical protein [Candidatus Sigynarchaeota archaeon]
MQDLKKWFDWAGLETSIIPGGIPVGNGRLSGPAIFAMDIGHKGRQQREFFRICPGDGTFDVHVIDVDTNLHQVVMFVREPERTFTETVWDPDQKKYVGKTRRTPAAARTLLVGKDQTHLFIAQLPKGNKPANTVKEAHRALKPGLVHQRESTTSRIKRQGEWFFIPATPVEEESIATEKAMITRHCGIGNRTGPRAHLAEELVTTRLGTFVRGSIRHPDHRPVELHSWFRVVANREEQRSWIGAAGVRWID